MLGEKARVFKKQRKTYKSALNPDQIRDLETFLDGLERAWDACKREGVQMDISRAIETLRHR